MDQPINWEQWEHLCSISLEVLPKMAAAKSLHCTMATASVCALLSPVKRWKQIKHWLKAATLGGALKCCVFPPNYTQQLCNNGGKPAAAFVCQLACIYFLGARHFMGRKHMKLRLFIKGRSKMSAFHRVCLSSAGQRAQTNMRTPLGCFCTVSPSKRAERGVCLWGTEAQSPRLSTGAVPLSSSPHLKQIYHMLCYVFSSHKRKEVWTPDFVVFHRPDEPMFTLLPSARCQIWLLDSSSERQTFFPAKPHGRPLPG